VLTKPTGAPGQLRCWCSSRAPAVEPDPMCAGRSGRCCPSRAQQKGHRCPTHGSGQPRLGHCVGRAVSPSAPASSFHNPL